MESNFIPEYVIYKYLTYGFAQIKQDFVNAQDPANSFLFRAFNGVKIGNFDYYEQSKVIVVGKEAQSKSLQVYVGNNINPNAVPSIHIILPSENMGEANMLGFGKHYQQSDIIEDNNVYAKTQSYYTVSFQATYTLMVVGNSNDECNLIYRLVQHIITAFNQELQAEGMINLKISGSDVDFETNVNFPERVYSRVCNLSFTYQVTSPEFKFDYGFKNTEVEIKTMDC